MNRILTCSAIKALYLKIIRSHANCIIMNTNVLGIGNALVDVIIFLENDSLLNDLALPKGSMQLVNSETAETIEKLTSSLKRFSASGGSAANTIHGLSKLGIHSGFIGTVGNDEKGNFFRTDLEKSGIHPYLATSNQSTGRAIALVSTDGERTFATFLGAAVELAAYQLNPEVFRAYGYLHLEGYLIPQQELVIRAAQLAREYGLIISLDLASYNVVQTNLDFIRDFIRQYVDIVFANEEEAKAITRGKEPGEALLELRDICSTVIIKISARGSLIMHNSTRYDIPAWEVKCLDTTGAGDLYAAGYIYGFLKNLDPVRCGKAGSLLAGKVIEEPGAKISEAGWKFIMDEISRF